MYYLGVFYDPDTVNRTRKYILLEERQKDYFIKEIFNGNVAEFIFENNLEARINCLPSSVMVQCFGTKINVLPVNETELQELIRKEIEKRKIISEGLGSYTSARRRFLGKQNS